MIKRVKQRMTIATIPGLIMVLLCATLSHGFGQIDTDIAGGSSFSLPLPDQRVILQPGQTVTFVVDPWLEEPIEPLPEFRDAFIEFGEPIWPGRWFALMGDLRYLGKGIIEYRAPIDEGFDLIVYRDETTGEYTVLAVTVDISGEEPCPEPVPAPLIKYAGLDVYLMPIQSNIAGMRVMALPPGDGFGVVICLTGRPLNPRPSRCSGSGFTTTRWKTFLRCTDWKYRGTIRVTADIQAKVWAKLGIRLTIGATFRVEERECRSTKLKIQDCYRCRNGVPEYVGSRVFYWIVHWSEFRPSWACVIYGGQYAIPCQPPLRMHDCVSNGDCPC